MLAIFLLSQKSHGYMVHKHLRIYSKRITLNYIAELLDEIDLGLVFTQCRKIDVFELKIFFYLDLLFFYRLSSEKTSGSIYD